MTSETMTPTTTPDAKQTLVSGWTKFMEMNSSLVERVSGLADLTASASLPSVDAADPLWWFMRDTADLPKEIGDAVRACNTLWDERFQIIDDLEDFFELNGWMPEIAADPICQLIGLRVWAILGTGFGDHSIFEMDDFDDAKATRLQGLEASGAARDFPLPDFMQAMFEDDSDGGAE